MNCTNNGYFIKPSYASSVSQIQPEYLQDDYIQIGNDVFKIGKTDYMCFNVSFLNDSGYFLADYGNKQGFGLFNYSPDFSSTKISCIVNPDGKVNKCGPFSSEEDKKRARDVEFSYYTETSLSKVATCNSNETFDPGTQKCYRDCSKDGGINKIGLPGGGCIDCSKEKTSLAALQCLCRGFGNSSNAPIYGGKNGGSIDDCNLEGTCGDGFFRIFFTNPSCNPDNNPDPKPDNNKTKPDDPKPNPDDPKPDPGGDSGGGNSGGGGGGNNGGSQDNPNPNPGGGNGDNPDPKPNPNPGGGSGGGGNGGKDDGKNKDGDAKFNEGDFNADGLNKEMGAFQKAYRGAFSQIEKNFEGSEGFNSFKNGIDQFISNLKGKGLNDISKKNVPKTCSHKETIEFFGYSVVMDFDFCKVVAPASDAFYYLFYVFFFGCFLFLIIKFLIFSF